MSASTRSTKRRTTAIYSSSGSNVGGVLLLPLLTNFYTLSPKLHERFTNMQRSQRLKKTMLMTVCGFLLVVGCWCALLCFALRTRLVNFCLCDFLIFVWSHARVSRRAQRIHTHTHLYTHIYEIWEKRMWECLEPDGRSNGRSSTWNSFSISFFLFDCCLLLKRRSLGCR